MSASDTLTGGCVISGNEGYEDRVTALYDAHVRDVYRYVHRMCLDHAVAEDVTQDVFLAVLRDPPAEVTLGWLMRSARNRLIDIIRRDTNYREKLNGLTRTTEGMVTDEVGALVENLRMSEALEHLAPHHRISLMLHYVDGCSVSDLAVALGRSYKGAEGLLSRARAALRNELEADR